MKQISLNRRQLLAGTAWVAVGTALGPFRGLAAALTNIDLTNNTKNNMNTITFTKTAAPEWLLAMWKEIDDKTFGKGFDCFAEDAVCNLGVADWHGREAIRENLRAFIDKGFTAHHDVAEYWDSPTLKVFHGKVGMKFNDPGIKPVRPTMCHFFYMDPKDPTKVSRWIGAVGPTGF
jgi:hypothetical protein